MDSCPVRAEQVLEGHGRPLRTTLSRPSDWAKYEIALDMALHFGPEDHSCAEKLNKNNDQVGRETLQLFKSGQSGHTGDLGPGLEGPGPGGSVLGGRAVIAAEVEQVVDLIVSREEALGLTRRLEALHLPLPSSRRLMRGLGSIFQALVPPMLDRGHHLTLRGAVARQLVRDHHTRGPALLLEQLPEQAFGGPLVAPALNQNVEHDPILVDGPPEPMLLAADHQA